MIDWPIGSQIVCIDAEPHTRYSAPGSSGTLDGLTEGQVYTVKSIYVNKPTGRVCVELCEIERKTFPWQKNSIGFCCARFRPVKKTSIDVFTRMLTNIPADLELV